MEICRLCFDSNSTGFVPLNLQIGSLHRKQLGVVFPEIDLESVSVPYLCSRCSAALESAYVYKSTWLACEEKLKKYVERNPDLPSYSLSDVVNDSKAEPECSEIEVKLEVETCPSVPDPLDSTMEFVEVAVKQEAEEIDQGTERLFNTDYPPSTSKAVRIADKEFETSLQKWLDEIDTGSDDDEDNQNTGFELSNPNTESEQSNSDLEQTDVDNDLKETSSDNGEDIPRNRYYYGKNKFKWSSVEPQRNSQTPLDHNIVTHLPGIRASGRIDDHNRTEKVWNLLFDDEMIGLVVRWTNVKLEKMVEEYKRADKPELMPVDDTEIKGFLGLLIYTAIFKCNNEDITSIFATDGTGRDIFRLVMSQKRFIVLLSCIRFDNPHDKVLREANDRAAAFSQLLNRFFQNSQTVFSIGQYVCVEEMLVDFRGRCDFEIHMPANPNKYGFKLMMLIDACNGYAYNGYLYCGKDSDCLTLPQDEKKLTKPTQNVLRLVQPLNGTNRNIMGDNWVSSIELVKELKKRKLTYLGTLRKNTREIPSEFLPNDTREVNSSLYGFTKDMTLLSYVPKKRKAILMISSMHHSKATNADVHKPEMILHYNAMKNGIEPFNEKRAIYTSSRRTPRWTMAIFFQIVNMSTSNAFVVYNNYEDNQRVQRFEFMKDLARNLVEPHMHRRVSNLRIPQEIRTGIRKLLNVNPEPECQEVLEKRKYCYVCPRRLKRKTQYACQKCRRPVCLQCARKVCVECCAWSE